MSSVSSRTAAVVLLALSASAGGCSGSSPEPIDVARTAAVTAVTGVEPRQAGLYTAATGTAGKLVILGE